jgi:transcriptional regulator with XRE-family HTH domain
VASTEYPIAAVAEVIRDACRALGWSQRELSRRSGVPQTAISRMLRGRLDSVDLDQLARIGVAVGARVRLVVDAPFLSDRARQRDVVHARCIGYVATRLRLAGWMVATEIEIRGSRGSGWIDVLAMHPASGRLLVIEIKTEIDDLGRIQRTLGWYEHEAWAAARRLGWRPRRTIATLLLLATQANDRRLRENRELVRVGFPGDASSVRAVLAGADQASPTTRAVAMIDPLSRSSVWLRSTVLDGRRSASPHEDYAAVSRRLRR